MVIVVCFTFGVSSVGAVVIKVKYDFKNYTDNIFLETASTYIDFTIDKTPDSYQLHYVQGMLYLLQERTEQSEKELLRVIRLKPDHSLSYLYLGYLASNNNPKKAIYYFKNAIKYRPNDAIMYNVLAVYYAKQNKMSEALKVLEKGISKVPNDDSLYYNQSLILMENHKGQGEKIKKVIRNMTRAIEISPEEEYYFILACAYLSKKKYTEARAEYNNILIKNPNNIYAYLGLATTYKETHQYNKAIEIAQKALKIEPDNQEVIDEIKEYEEEYSKWKNNNTR